MGEGELVRSEEERGGGIVGRTGERGDGERKYTCKLKGGGKGREGKGMERWERGTVRHTWHKKYGPLTFVVMHRSKSSSVVSSSVFIGRMPALAIRMSMPPNRSTVCLTRSSISAILPASLFTARILSLPCLNTMASAAAESEL